MRTFWPEIMGDTDLRALALAPCCARIEMRSAAAYRGIGGPPIGGCGGVTFVGPTGAAGAM